MQTLQRKAPAGQQVWTQALLAVSANDCTAVPSLVERLLESLQE